MSDYKKSVLNKFGIGTIAFSFNDLKLAEGQSLPAAFVGETVHLKKLSGAEFEDFAARVSDVPQESLMGEKFRGVRADLVSRCWCDPAGDLLYPGDVEGCNNELSNESLGVFFVACQQINGMVTKAQEEAEKNS